MVDLIAEFAGQRRERLQLGPALNTSGGSADIHRVLSHSGVVAKMYRSNVDKAEYARKVRDMIRRPPAIAPIKANGRDYHQIAWPLATLSDANGVFLGFIMPEVDMKVSTELQNALQKSARQARKIPEFYGNRVLLAANLAGVLVELHRLEHYFVDLKPINIRFYPDMNYLAVLDTDGFSIKGAQRWPARLFSDEYIPPEAKGLDPSQLGLEADLFALAAIIFQLLNNGIHPFQGIDRVQNLPATIQERIYAQLYAYGEQGSLQTLPSRMSVHTFFDPALRRLFDRAFTGPPSKRPPAREWNDLLKDLIIRKIFVKCRKNPAEHGHFGQGCGFCALEHQQQGATIVKPPLPTQIAVVTKKRFWQRRSWRNTYAPGNTSKSSTRRRLLICSAFGVSALAGWKLFSMWPNARLFAAAGNIPVVPHTYQGTISTINGQVGVSLSLRRNEFDANGSAQLIGTYYYTKYHRPVRISGSVNRRGSFKFQGWEGPMLIDSFSGQVASDGELSGDYTRQSDGKRSTFAFRLK